MDSYIIDWLYVKTLQKKIGRKLALSELAGEVPVRYYDVDGREHREWIKRVNLKTLYGKGI